MASHESGGKQVFELKLNNVLSPSSSSYTAPRAVDVRQEVEQIRAKGFFYSTFTNVSFSFFNFFTFVTFLFFVEHF